MKNLKRLNTFAILLPCVILITTPIFGWATPFCALLSTMLTGFLQVGIALRFWYCNKKNALIILYLTSTFVYLIYFLTSTNYNIYTIDKMIPPICLIIFLTIILHKKNIKNN